MSVCSIVRMVKSFMESGKGKGELGSNGDDDLVWDIRVRGGSPEIMQLSTLVGSQLCTRH